MKPDYIKNLEKICTALSEKYTALSEKYTEAEEKNAILLTIHAKIAGHIRDHYGDGDYALNELLEESSNCQKNNQRGISQIKNKINRIIKGGKWRFYIPVVLLPILFSYLVYVLIMLQTAKDL